MSEKQNHPADEHLLLHDGGELPAGRGAEVRAHVESCSRCHARLQELRRLLSEVAELHRENARLEEARGTLPSADASRARLETRMMALSARDREAHEEIAGIKGSTSLLARFFRHRQTAVLAGLTIAACLLVAIRLRGPQATSDPLSASLGRLEEPDTRLTPGATLPVTQTQVCGSATETIPVVPVSLKVKVFEEYGVTPPRPDAYEVDYLITPQLGGATDIRNLWPEPYRNIEWNAHVKDQLEDRLHRMVCHGEVDLATAQHDISTDWIAAYRKYFHADRPVADTSTSNLPRFEDSPPRRS